MLNVTIEEYLEPFSPEMKKITSDLRTVIHSLPFEFVERVYPGWKLIGYRVKHKTTSSYIGFIYVTGSEVQLGFEYGASIRQSGHQLGGTGTQVRHLAFRNPSEINGKIILPILLEAIDLAMKGKK